MKYYIKAGLSERALFANSVGRFCQVAQKTKETTDQHSVQGSWWWLNYSPTVKKNVTNGTHNSGKNRKIIKYILIIYPLIKMYWISEVKFIGRMRKDLPVSKIYQFSASLTLLT